MPIYEYTCPEHGRFEHLQTKVGPDDIIKCFKCELEAKLQVSVASIDPDDLWNGKYFPALGKTFHSKSELKRHMIQQGLEFVTGPPTGADPGVKQRAIDVAEVARSKEREKHIASAVQADTL